MEKAGEEWCNNSITSTFWVPFNGDRPVCDDKGAIFSDTCGFGWKFGIWAKSDKIYFCFCPHHLLGARMGTLTLSARQKPQLGVAARKLQTYDCSLEREYSDWFSPFSFNKVAKHPIFEFTVTFAASLHLPPLPVPISPGIKGLLNDSILGNDSVDIKFYLFSRWMPSRRASHPLPLYINSSVLKGHSSYLDTLVFEEGFKESTPVDLSTAVAPESLNSPYDYESDSDLESVSEDNGESGDFSGTSDIAKSPGSSLTTDMPREGLKSDGSDPVQVTTAGNVSLFADGKSASVRLNPIEQHGHHQRMGRVISIKDTAFATWKALLYYLHTRDLNFLPLKSRRSHLSSPEMLAVVARSQTPPCSPKSMYRLADKIGMEELKEFAFQAISSDLTEENIVQELFSEFTSRYPQIRAMEIETLGRHYTKPQVVKDLEWMAPGLAHGSFPHSSEIVASLLGRLQFK